MVTSSKPCDNNNNKNLKKNKPNPNRNQCHRWKTTRIEAWSCTHSTWG